MTVTLATRMVDGPAIAMSDQHEHEHEHESPNIDNLTPEEASRIIHSHRKVRYGMLLTLNVNLLAPLAAWLLS